MHHNNTPMKDIISYNLVLKFFLLSIVHFLLSFCNTFSLSLILFFICISTLIMIGMVYSYPYYTTITFTKTGNNMCIF